MRLRSLRVAAAFVALAFVLPGCGSRSNKNEIRLAFVSNNPEQFWRLAQRGTEKFQKDSGVIVEFKMPPNGKAEEQQQFINDLLVKGIKGIAISANDAKNMSDYLTDVGKKVPLITVDNDIPNAAGRRAYIGTNNYIAGRAAGELVKKAVPKGGKIVIFVGQMDATNAVERRQGVLDVLAGIDQKEIGKLTPANAQNVKFGDFLLVDTRTDGVKQEECQRQCEDILTKDPEIAAIVGLWAYNPPAMLRAAEKVKSKAAIIGFDEYDDTLQGIKDGKIVATVVQAPYEFGKRSMEILADVAKGNNDAVKNVPGIDDQNRIYIPHQIIDSSNVDRFRADINEKLGKTLAK
jgi:ribose transport system substrate-binding protein